MDDSRGPRRRNRGATALAWGIALALAASSRVVAAQPLAPTLSTAAPEPSRPGLRLHFRAAGFLAGGYNHQLYERYEVNVGFFAAGSSAALSLRTSDAFAFGSRLDAWGLVGRRESTFRTVPESRSTFGYGGYIGVSLSFFLGADGFSVLDLGAGFMGGGRGGDFGGIGPGFNVGFARFFGGFGRSAFRQGIEVRALVNVPQLSTSAESTRLLGVCALVALGYTFGTF